MRFKTWCEAKRKDNPEQRTFNFNPIEIGDEVTYTPNNTKYEDVITGFVVEEIKGMNNEIGYNIQADPDDPQHLTRIWTNKGSITPTGKVAPWKEQPKQEIPKPKKDDYQKPYKNAGDLATQYKKQGLNRYRAWDQFVIDTILSPKYRSEQLDAKDFYKLYDSY